MANQADLLVPAIRPIQFNIMFRKALVVSFVLAAHAVAQRINMLPAAMVARQTTAAAASSVQTINPSQISAEL